MAVECIVGAGWPRRVEEVVEASPDQLWTKEESLLEAVEVDLLEAAEVDLAVQAADHTRNGS